MSAVFRAALAAALVVLAACGGGDGGARVDGAWARATPGAVTNGAIYLEITAPGGDALTGVAVDDSVAAIAELHETVDADGAMTMRPVTEVTIPDGETVAFAPGGLHVMLMGLVEPLTPGDSFPLTLTFSRSGEVVVDVDVLLDAPDD